MKMMVRVGCKLWLEDEEGRPLLGEGAAELLRRVSETGSLNRAAGAMHMSYRAAWGMLRELEDRLGFPLLSRGSGGSRLTPEGRRLLERFEAWVADSRQDLEKLRARYFGGEP